MSRTANVIAVASAIAMGFVGTDAIASAGSPTEKVRYGRQVDTDRLSCPKGTTRVLQQTARGLEESCVDRSGDKQGYYLRWHSKNRIWAELGQFKNGKKIGRWIRWSEDGAKSWTTRHTKTKRRR